MASKITTLAVVIVVLLIGVVHAQDDESNEQVGAARFNLADILTPNDQEIPLEQNQDGDAESNEQQAAAQTGTGNAAGGKGGEVGRQLGDGVFFSITGKVEAKPQMTGDGDADAESTEAGGAAMEAAAAAEENEEEQESNVGEQNESEGTEEPEVGEQNEEMEGEEADTEETEGGMAVMGGEDQEETPMGTGGNNPFVVIKGEQHEGEGETTDAPEMVGGDGEGAQIGAAGDESGEEAQVEGEGGAQTAGGTTESGEQEGAIGQQGGADVDSTEVADGGTFMGSDNIEGSDGMDASSSVMTTTGGVLLEEATWVTKATEALGTKAPDTPKPDLKMNPLAAKAKQTSDTETTEQPAPTTTQPDEEEGGKTSEGLSDATKTRIAISVSAVGAVMLVGAIAAFIGKRAQRRPHTNA